MTDKWIRRFIQQAETTASWSKDPRRKVGCVITSDNYNILSGGFNGFPRKIKDDERLNDHAIKNSIIIHAEINAVAAAALHGHSLKDSYAFISHFPCTPCAGVLIQAGIKAVYCKWDTSIIPSNQTLTDLSNARLLLVEAEIQFNEITTEFMKYGV